MKALVRNPCNRAQVAAKRFFLILLAFFVAGSSTALGQDTSVAQPDYVKPLQERQRELARIDDALKDGIQQVERACMPFIEDGSLEGADLTANTFLQIDQARSQLERKSEEVSIRLKNAKNIAELKNSELCDTPHKTKTVTACTALKESMTKLNAIERYFLKAKNKNFEILNRFIIAGKLEALMCVRKDFTASIIKAYLSIVETNDISGLRYYQTKLDQLKSEIQAHE